MWQILLHAYLCIAEITLLESDETADGIYAETELSEDFGEVIAHLETEVAVYLLFVEVYLSVLLHDE